MKIGTRNSPLAILQAKEVATFITEKLHIPTELVEFQTLGDQDKSLDLRIAPPDFFTREIDHAIDHHTIDCAVHSAKDLPHPLPENHAFFWIPSPEDPRDAIVLRENANINEVKVWGSSSERRNAWIEKHYPQTEIRSIRGTIQERIDQLDQHQYDAVIIAMAALNRLNLAHRATQIIPLSDLESPEGQGALAVTFHQSNTQLMRVRQSLIYPVIFAGAGPGKADWITVETQQKLAQCDICLYDALGMNPLPLLNPKAKGIYVGKRLDGHSLKQHEISNLILKYACQGKKVVRLKGGDPGIFGRLAEETDLLSLHQIPFRVIPGISAFTAATTPTGLLLTRRGTSRGFSIMTPRTASENNYKTLSSNEIAEMSRIYFMSVAESHALCENLIHEGASASTTACAVFNASYPNQTILTGTLATLPEQIESYRKPFDPPPPGLILVGESFNESFLFKSSGLLAHQKVLLTCTEEIMPTAIDSVERFNGIAIPFPMIRMHPVSNIEEILSDIDIFDWLIISSPSVARCVMNHISDVRKLPKLLVCGTGTARVFLEHKIIPDAMPKSHFGNVAMQQLIQEVIPPRSRVLQLKSNLAKNQIPQALHDAHAIYESRVIAENIEIKQSDVPEFDSLFFASGSAIQSFASQFPQITLQNKTVCVIGLPAEKVFREQYGFSPTCVATESTVNDAIAQLAYMQI